MILISTYMWTIELFEFSKADFFIMLRELWVCVYVL